jgi:hypothetical protein
MYTRQQMGLLSIGESISNLKNTNSYVEKGCSWHFLAQTISLHKTNTIDSKPNECVSHDGNRDNKDELHRVPQITAAFGVFIIIMLSDSAGPKSKESAPAITAPVPSAIAQSFTSNGTVNNNVILMQTVNFLPKLSPQLPQPLPPQVPLPQLLHTQVPLPPLLQT